MKNQLWAVLIGSGMALSPIHNQWLTQLATDHNGVTWFFLPSLGNAMWIIGAMGFVWESCWRKEGNKEHVSIQFAEWGDWRITVPLAIIAAAIAVSGLAAGSWSQGLAILGQGAALFAAYLAARRLGKSVFLPLAIGAALASLGVIAYAMLHPGRVTGGFVFENNYDIVVGYILLGSALFVSKYQWLLVTLALIAMFLSGSPEGLFAVGALGLIVLWRKDYSRKLILTIGSMLVVVILYFSAGYGAQLYRYAAQVVQNEPAQAAIPQSAQPEERRAIEYRLRTIGTAMTNVKPFGNGYTQTDFRTGIVHNVPLVIVQQLGWPGVLAAVAWLWVCLWGLVKTKWKYVWALILILSVWDHYVWTQLGPLWWAIAGVTTASENIESDLIFRVRIEDKGNSAKTVQSLA